MNAGDRRGMLPLSSLGVLLIILTGALVLHFNRMERSGVERAVFESSEAEMLYIIGHASAALDEVVRDAGERAVTKHSMASYAHPIELNSWHGGEGNEVYAEWRGELVEEIEGEVNEGLVAYLSRDNLSTTGDSQIELDLDDFLGGGRADIIVTATPDSALEDPGKRLRIGFRFKEGRGVIDARSRLTQSTLSIKAGGDVSLASRPFSLGEGAFRFSGVFRNRDEGPDSADELAWYIWIMQELIGITEANLKHEVRFATDERALYSMTHLLVAFKEMQHFGSFDYVHTAQEFSRPWLGSNGEDEDFIGVLKEGVKKENVEALKKMLCSALFAEKAASLSKDISSALILASSHLDSETVSGSGRGFEDAVVPEEVSEHGAVEHLREASDVSRLEEVAGEIDRIALEIEVASGSVERNDINKKAWSGRIGDKKNVLYSENLQFREEVGLAKKDFETSTGQLTKAHSGYGSLEEYISESTDGNQIAEFLWSGDANTTGLEKILPRKREQTGALLLYYEEVLKPRLDGFEYGAAEEEKYHIDRYYSEAIDCLQKVEAELDKAGSAKVEYHSERYRFENCYTHEDSKDDAIPEGCWGQGYSCSPYRCLPHECNCHTVCRSTKKGSHCYKSCDTCWFTCYHACYDCSSACRTGFESRMRTAEEEYERSMREAAALLRVSSEDMMLLKDSVEEFFVDRGLDGFYADVEAAHGMFGPPNRSSGAYSVMDIYYAHPALDEDFNLERPYESAYLILNPEDTEGEDFSSEDYAISPGSPLAPICPEACCEFGHYYLHAVLESLDAALNGEALNKDILSKAGELLEELETSGFLDYLLEILEVAQNDCLKDCPWESSDLGFSSPHLREHMYTVLPLPPISLEYEPLGIESKGVSVIHDLRVRTDTHPGELEIETKIGKVGPLTLGSDDAVNPSFPVPFVPLHLYLWGFEVSPSETGSGDYEDSFLWLTDFENSANMAPLLEFEGRHSTEAPPSYLHKPIMYKFTFTAFEEPNQIAKETSLEYPPPVFVISPAPFLTRFGDHFEPPDR